MTEGSDMKITPSSGNVFADLGLANADDLLAEADQLLRIRSASRTREFAQAQARSIPDRPLKF